MEHTIDAQNQKLGRLASKIAHLLMSKDSVDFARNKIPKTKVTVINASKMDVSEKKLKEKTYVTYSGYPGGLKKERLEEKVAKKGMKDALENAVSGMLPKNKLRTKMLINLTIND